VHGLETAIVRGRVISVVQLDHIFQWKQSANAAQNQVPDDKTLVIVSSDGREIGLVVDKPSAKRMSSSSRWPKTIVMWTAWQGPASSRRPRLVDPRRRRPRGSVVISRHAAVAV